MTTPTPPEGYRKPTEEELKKLPSRSLVFKPTGFFGTGGEWRFSGLVGCSADVDKTYAVPITPESQARQICGAQQCPQRVTHYEGECPNCSANNPPADGNPSYEQRLWDEYAGRALQGLSSTDEGTCADETTLAEHAANLADAMMAERAKRMKGDK